MQNYIVPSNHYDGLDWITSNIYCNKDLFKSDFRPEPVWDKKNDNKKRERFEGTYSFVDSEVPTEATETKPTKKTSYFALKEERYKVFTGVPKWWKYFTYHITAVKQDWNYNKKSLYKVEDVVMKRLPMTVNLLRTMLLDLKCSEVFIENFLRDAPWMRYNTTAPSELDIKDVLKYIQKYEDDQVFGPLMPRTCINALVCDHKGLKYYFLHDQVNFLMDYYKMHEILGLKWKNIVLLKGMFEEDILQLCFRKLIPFKSYYKDDSDGKSSNRMEKKIPELTMQHLINYHRSVKKPLPLDVKMKVDIYAAVCAESSSKDYYIELRAIENQLSLLHPELFTESMNWLCEKKVILCTEEGEGRDQTERVYLWKNYKQEMCIAQCVQKLFDRDLNHMCGDIVAFDPMDDKPSGVVDITEPFSIELPPISVIRERGKKLCSEQFAALLLILYKRAVAITGKAGSGKTFTIEILKLFFKLEDIFITAFQKTNVNNLNYNFKDRCYTTHKLLLLHNSTCHRSPHISKEQRNNVDTIKETKNGLKYTKCIFEKTRILIVEEASLMPTALFSHLLAAVTQCGKLEKLIILGDYGQTQPILGGNLMEDFIGGFEKLGCFLEFFHNHRVGKGILSDNQDAIRDRNPEGLVFDGQKSIFVPIKTNDQIEEALKETLKKYNVPEYKSQIISRTNDIKDIANRAYQSYYLAKENRTKEEMQVMNQCPNRYKYVFYTGRKVAFKVNDYDQEISNNESLQLKRILDIYAKSLGTDAEILQSMTNTSQYPKKGYIRRFVVHSLNDPDKDNERVITLTPELRNSLVRFGASTIIGAQGGQHDTVIFIIVGYSPFNTNRGVYTAYSRTVSRIIVIGNLEILKRAIVTEDPIRRTGLAEKIYRLCCARASEREKMQQHGMIPSDSVPKELQEEVKKKKGAEKTADFISAKKRAEEAAQEKLYRENEWRVISMCQDVWILIFKEIINSNHNSDRNIRFILTLGRVCVMFYNMSQNNQVWLDIRERCQLRYDAIKNGPQSHYLSCIEVQDLGTENFGFVCNYHTLFTKFKCPKCKTIYHEIDILHKVNIKSSIQKTPFSEKETSLFHTEIKCPKSHCAFTFDVHIHRLLKPDPTCLNDRLGVYYLPMKITNVQPVFNLLFLRHYKNAD